MPTPRTGTPLPEVTSTATALADVLLPNGRIEELIAPAAAHCGDLHPLVARPALLAELQRILAERLDEAGLAAVDAAYLGAPQIPTSVVGMKRLIGAAIGRTTSGVHSFFGRPRG